MAMKGPSITAVLGIGAGMVAVLSNAATLAQQAPAQAPATASAAAAEPARNLENGKKLFEKYGCSDCHGLLGQGAPTSGPRIAPNPLPLAAFIRYVRAPRLQMPPYTAKVMPDQELADVRAYLATVPKPAPVTVLAP
jgi:ubiquinol-cytochrome c reductase cytochrome c subunit